MNKMEAKLGRPLPLHEEAKWVLQVCLQTSVMHEGCVSHLLPGLRTALATKIKGISSQSVTVETSACLPSLLTACTTYVQRMADERLLAGSLQCPVHCGNPVESDGEAGCAGFPRELSIPSPQDPLPVIPSC